MNTRNDVEFSLGAVPNRYQDVIQRMTTLVPLRGVCRGADAVRAATLSILSQWRCRLAELHEAGWYSTDNARTSWFARNCCPTFAVPSRWTRACRQRDICPFCYARRTREIWLRLSEALFPQSQDEQDIDEDDADSGPSLSSFHLVERRHTFRRQMFIDGASAEEVLANLLQSVTAQRSEAVRMVDPSGGFLFTTITPDVATQEWVLQHRQLYKIRPEQEIPQLMVDGTNGVLIRHEQLTRRGLLTVVAGTCRYPEELMTADPAAVAKLLNVRRRWRFQSYLFFRGFRQRHGYSEYD